MRCTAVVSCWLALLAVPNVAHASLAWSVAVTVDSHAAGTGLDAVACPSASLCVAVDGQGREATFNPQAPQGATDAVVAGSALIAVACPALAQCTAIDTRGEQVTFDPQSPSGATPTSIDTNAVPLSVACPSATQCTAVDSSGEEVTFTPPSGGGRIDAPDRHDQQQ